MSTRSDRLGTKMTSKLLRAGSGRFFTFTRGAGSVLDLGGTRSRAVRNKILSMSAGEALVRDGVAIACDFRLAMTREVEFAGVATRDTKSQD